MKLFKIIPAFLMAAAIAFVGCEKNEDLNHQQARNGSFKVRMTDSPGAFAALDVQIIGVEAFLENEGWVELSNETQFINVLELTNGAETELAFEAEAEAGTYSQLKVIFGEENTITVDVSEEGTAGSAMATFDLEWALGSNEVIIEIDEEVSANSSANVLVDFNVLESIQQQAEEYFLDPALALIEDASTGIQGQASGAINAAIELTGPAGSFSGYTDLQGNFMLVGVTEGIYDMEISPSPSDILAGLPEELTIESVVIASGQITQMGSIQF